MKLADALRQYLVEKNVAPADARPEDLYGGNWMYINIAGRRMRFFPSIGFRSGLPAHDSHHMLNGYETNWVGECETAAWELASGGCGRYPAYWVDRIIIILIAFVAAPIRSARAWRRGIGHRNLYRLHPDQLLAMDVEEVRSYIKA